MGGSSASSCAVPLVAVGASVAVVVGASAPVVSEVASVFASVVVAGASVVTAGAAAGVSFLTVAKAVSRASSASKLSPIGPDVAAIPSAGGLEGAGRGKSGVVVVVASAGVSESPKVAGRR